jgi:myo-inositol 2-dehydrogenase/D-chiro-inositol 1-dehydrogenase
MQKIKEALAAVDKAGVKLQVGFVRRFDHNHKKVHDTVVSGRLGKPHIVKITSRDPEGPPLSYIAISGGIFMDMTIHDFDMARYLAASEVTEVTAYGAINIDPDYKKYNDVDTAAVMLKFENGAIGLIDNSRAAHYGYDQRTEVHCDKGSVLVGNDLVDTSVISTAEGVFCEKPTWFFLERYNDAFIAEAIDFVDAINSNKKPPVDGKDGMMAVYIAMAAEKSLRENRSVKLGELIKGF